MKKIAIVQSNYIPWKGYFDMIAAVDEFILYDDMQYTRRDWRNRNYIKTPRGLEWLTIPVDVKGKYLQKIRETRVSDPRWAQGHWSTLVHNYSRARYFPQYRARFEELYLGCAEEMLSLINFRFIEAVCEILGIRTKISWSMDYDLVEGKTERLVGLCKSAGATHYLSGPAARDYIDESLFGQEGIGVSYMDYTGYRPHTQLHGDFQHTVTILDLILNEGPEARRFMKLAG
jgi:WbqC-like protein